MSRVRSRALVRRLGASGVAALSALAISGCGAPAGTEEAARSAAAGFASALSGGDLAAGCALLTDSAAGELEEVAADCTSALTELGLNAPGELEAIEVWGRAAVAHFAQDEVFLSFVDGEWQVAAAGCTPAPDEPADCLVGGA